MDDKVTLYIATHNTTGLKYFGKTNRYFTEEDLQENYHGSGTFWKEHLNLFGDNVTMEVYGVYSLNENDDDYVVPIALSFSRQNQIVGSSEWANLIPENGKGGGDQERVKIFDVVSKEYKTVSYLDFLDNNNYEYFNKGLVTVFNSDNERVRVTTKEYHNNKHKYKHFMTDTVIANVDGHIKHVSKDEFEKFNYSGHSKGKTLAIINEEVVQVSCKYFHENNLTGLNKGKITVLESGEDTYKVISIGEYYENKHKYKTPFSGLTKLCEYCGIKVDIRNFNKWHGDNCKLNKNSKMAIIQCPYCDKSSTNLGNMNRWHFDNCKQKEKNV